MFHNGEVSDKNLASTNRLNGSIAPNQLSYLLKKSKLLITTNPLAAQMAALFNKSFVFICDENIYKKYKFLWLKSKNYKVILNDKNIKPEEIALAALKFLDIVPNMDFETVYIGKKNFDGAEFIESVPNQICRFENSKQYVTIRMDLHFSEDFLTKQLNYFNCAIVTNKKINLDILKIFKHRIHQIIYFIEENDDPEFCNNVIKLGIETVFFSKLSKEERQKKKFHYMEMGLIHEKEMKNVADIENFKKIDLEKLYFLSNRFILSDSKVYPSEASYFEGKPTTSKTQINPVINSQSFWNDLDTFWILKKKS